jgi:hypothetical protein
MIKLRGEEISRAFYESQASAVDRIEEIQKLEKIDCDFRRLDGYCFRRSIPIRRSSMRKSTRSARSAHPSTALSAFRSRDATSSMRCAIRDRRLSIR